MTRAALPSLTEYVNNIVDEAAAKGWRREHKASLPATVSVGGDVLAREGFGDGYSRDVRGVVVKKAGRRVLLEFKSGERLWAEYDRPDAAYDLARPLWSVVRT